MARNYALGNQMVFDVLKRQVSTETNVVSIGGREAVILKLLCDHVNEVVGKEYIQEKVWGKVFVSETSLTKAISNLRKSLSQFDNLACEIKTISKEGYMLILDESVSRVFIQEEQPVFEVKNIKQSRKSYLSNMKVAPYPIERNLSIRTDIPMRNIYFLLVCFSSALLASMLTAGAIVIFNKFF
ncbi:helix-turn-helix domain-containing protein [Shewanella baltica]|uniref:winged helix-turn-helix domain-containing protein n=1 Tax=Shewanella baltica TaxID=62322 RepID=UPI0001E11244|nr:winged helix-turn-helix domain-containing protein [Shewanella baltica]AEG13374.1 transcriptional regulator, CadC [Shewanella baltica BA175]EHQ13081.1 transcriptional regulator, CadC [Shewanella baltica OS183]MCS6235384.1 helix-turn-helix domain-containing protein [Shewanella baltica]MCS6259483.1 helix-turn-helix domain-containing protein [Shewanella baltica]MCS6270002.1 helix-turn-helix domain-containing protein [Shewanella baltica]